jgi:hypothetical protein
MFIRWTRDDKWLYGADISAKWASKNEDKMVLTVSFGPDADPATGVQKTINLDIYDNSCNNTVLIQKSATLDLNFTWKNPAAKQANPKIVVSGNIIDNEVALVAVDDVYLNITVDPAS